ALYLLGDPFHLFFLSPYAYVADRIFGLYVINCSNPSSPNIVARLRLRGTATRLALSGNRVCVAHEYGGLRIVDITNPSAPNELGFTLDYPVYGVGILNNYAITACGTNGVRIFDISTPSYPIETAYLDMGGNIVDVVVRAPYAYVIDRWYGLYVVDVSNPYVPSVVGSLAGSSFSRIAVSGNYAFVSARADGLKIINIQDPSNPTLITTYTDGANILSSYPVGNKLYVAKGSAGFEVLDITNISNPLRLWHYISTGFVEDVYGFGELAFLASGPKGVEVLRVSEQTGIRLVGYYDTGDYALSLVARSTDTLVFLADSWDGLWVLDASDVYLNIAEKETEKPASISIDIYPNPFNSSANIELELDKPEEIELSVSNLLGENISTIFNGKLGRGKHIIKWKPEE
ncbi:MAG: hypothetical protein ACPL6C_04140, partial [bacterium]